MKKLDALTKEEFVPKRINQRFAKASNRIKYHNEKAKELRHSLSFVYKPLQKNLMILNELMSNENEKKFHKQFLLGKGYNLMLITHKEKYNNKIINALFKYGIISIDNENIKFIKL